MFCKLEHMCYLNKQTPIIIDDAYWLFVTTKKTRRFFKNLKLVQFKYEMVIDLSFCETPYLVIILR